MEHQAAEGQVQWNMADTLKQLDGDQMLLREVLHIFLREAPQHLAALGVAVEERNAEQVESVAHTMKGELGYLGVPAVSLMARDLEGMGHAGDLEGAAGLFPRFAARVSGLFCAVRASGVCPADSVPAVSAASLPASASVGPAS